MPLLPGNLTDRSGPFNLIKISAEMIDNGDSILYNNNERYTEHSYKEYP
jgi:hypothetical protein